MGFFRRKRKSCSESKSTALSTHSPGHASHPASQTHPVVAAPGGYNNAYPRSTQVPLIVNGPCHAYVLQQSVSYPPISPLPQPPRYPSSSPPEPQVLQYTNWSSCTNMVAAVDCPIPRGTVDYIPHGIALYGVIGDRLNDVITRIDDEAFTGNKPAASYTFEAQQSPPPAYQKYLEPNVWKIGPPNDSKVAVDRKGRTQSADQTITRGTNTDLFGKAYLYANSFLPAQLPSLEVYMPTWQVLCLAARFSRDAYLKSQRVERDGFIEANCRLGTKAMVMKPVALDDMNTVVLAIRGTSNYNFIDWTINLNTQPTSPAGFLDDDGNLCHAGFLDVARKSIKPIASRLRSLLEENPTRASFSLVITGHSAGGAVAALLYTHMLSETVRSDLSILRDCFKRIHCITFGAPPVSLLPLAKPPNSERRLKHSLFFGIINEGDPVARAEKSYIRNLIDLYTRPPPTPVTRVAPLKPNNTGSSSKTNLATTFAKHKKNWSTTNLPASAEENRVATNVIWKVPPATLSNAGRLVVLRGPVKGRDTDVRAYTTTDEQLRRVIFGDIIMHKMDVYCKRIEILAKRAVTAGLSSSIA